MEYPSWQHAWPYRVTPIKSCNRRRSGQTHFQHVTRFDWPEAARLDWGSFCSDFVSVLHDVLYKIAVDALDLITNVFGQSRVVRNGWDMQPFLSCDILAVTDDRFDLEKLGETMLTTFAAIPGLTVPAKRRLGIKVGRVYEN